MKYVSPLRAAALACNIMLRTLPHKIVLNFPDNASNMRYSHFFSSLVQVLELLITQLHNFSIYFIECLLLYMLLSVSYVISTYQYGSN